MAFWGHCAVELNITHAVVAGGRNPQHYHLKTVYIFTLAQSYWNWMGDMENGRSGHVCGTVTDADTGSLILVFAGGGSEVSVELFSISTQTWVAGPQLPHELDKAIASFKATNAFFIIGGLHLGKCPVESSDCISSRYVYELKPDKTGWDMRQVTMRLPRGQHVGIQLPRKTFSTTCQEACDSCRGILFWLLTHRTYCMQNITNLNSC